ncbi:uncharacterized protein RCO7_07432 [Rhynchosporium graminicola]|uniref:C2H2-type domain-containing protein n=1 Tax=Rhynchosporium graminicola TaxID=2792576 RepID=A0A1E1LFV7_9HELO|nr:uncharacterized protein RCO7_07432 [Rhynchosporium commune]
MSNNHDSRMSIDAILNVIPDLQSFRPRLPPFETLGRPSCPGVERHNVLVQGITPAVDVDTDMEFYAETTLPRINITQFEDEEMDSDEELQMMMDAQVVDEEPEPTSSPQWVSVTKRTPLPSGRTMTTDDVAKAQKAKKKSFTCDVCTRIFCTKDGFRQHKQSKGSETHADDIVSDQDKRS